MFDCEELKFDFSENLISVVSIEWFNRYKNSDKHYKDYNSRTHWVLMLFCRFAKSLSVRDISNGLRSATGNLNHLGIQKAPSKSTISYQNERRDFNLFRDYYYYLLKRLEHYWYFSTEIIKWITINLPKILFRQTHKSSLFV